MRLPRTDTELALWLNNFSTSFTAYADALGFTEADVNSVKADAAMLNYIVGDLLPTYKSALQSRTSFKNLVMSGPTGTASVALPMPPTTGAAPAVVPAGIVPRLRNLIQRIQLSPGYTEQIGLDLGISERDGVGPSVADAAPKPSVRARSTGPGTVQVDFSKEKYDGVVIESQRDGDDEWQSLGLDSYSPYIDDRPPKVEGKPETRQYRARYMLRDQPTGEWSDIVTTTFVP
ncbi:MAG: hypothetical protein JOZ96_23970 [Acidobacteria bacterium]|nr:hypothetical protein [Acidobacteriota bacterium]